MTSEPGDPGSDLDAIIVAGGRASRLGGIDKTALEFEGGTLLSRTIAAAHGAGRVCVVAADSGASVPGPAGSSPRLLYTREDPPLGGPAAAIVAGIRALKEDTEPPPTPGFTAVLAGDLTRPGPALATLILAAREAPDTFDGVVAVDSAGRRQTLLAIYRTPALRSAAREAGDADGLPVRRLIAPLNLLEVPVADELCADVDTPADAARLGITVPPPQHDGHAG